MGDKPANVPFVFAGYVCFAPVWLAANALNEYTQQRGNVNRKNNAAQSPFVVIFFGIFSCELLAAELQKVRKSVSYALFALEWGLIVF